MYRVVDTHKPFRTLSGAEAAPILTLEDEYGGICHITEEDGCYISYLYIEDSGFVPITHIFSELYDALCKLGTPTQSAEVVNA